MKKILLVPLLFVLAILLPVGAQALDDPAPAATAALIVDADNREVLYAFNAHEHRFPASITKVMTALLVLEDIDRGALKLDQVIVASSTYQIGLSADGSSQNIKPGEEMTVLDLLYCTLVSSANEACNILAEASAGSVAAFVDRMNERAAALGMEDTHFANAHGLHNADHYTSAYDIWLMCEQAMTHRTFREITSAVSHVVPATNLTGERKLYTTNALLSQYRITGYLYSHAIGIKTGSTPEAGQCLVSAAIRNKRTFYCVILGAENIRLEDNTLDRQSFSESKRLLEWAFGNFSRKTVLSDTAPLVELPVELSQEVSYVALKPDAALEATLPNDVDPATFTVDTELFHEVIDAPVVAGTVLGRVTVSDLEGVVLGECNLIAVSNVSRSELLYRLRQVRQFFEHTYVRIALIAAAAVLLFVWLRLRVFRSKKRRSRSAYRRRR